MKVLFIIPLNESFHEITHVGGKDWKFSLNDRKNIKRINCCYPGGVLSIGSYLKKHIPEIEIKIIDLNIVINRFAQTRTEGLEGYSHNDFYAGALSIVADFKPDIIGLSFLFCDSYPDLKPLTDLLMSVYPDTLMIAGGHLVSGFYDQVFNDGTPLDAIAFAEGEIPMLELCQAMKEGRATDYLSTSPAWIMPEKISGNPFKPQRMLVANLDDIPRYDLDMLVFPEAYYNSSENILSVASSQKDREMYIFSTRGCPYHCVFCASQNVHGHKIRAHSIERIKSDVEYYRQKCGITRFVFCDDHFLGNKADAIELLKFIHGSNLQVDIMGAASFAIDADVAATLHEVGIRQINISMESGNENTLQKIIRKPSSLKKVETAIEYLHTEDISVISCVVIGFPGETKESIEKGFQYLLGTNVDWFFCLIAAPLPGSDLYRICKENGYLTDDYLKMDMKTTGKGVIRTPEFSPEYIEKKAYEMNLMLNFVNNYGMRTGNYQNALRMFERIINITIDTHAFAYYFAAKCCSKLDLQDQYLLYKTKYNEMIDTYPFWKEWSDYFHLEPLL